MANKRYLKKRIDHVCCDLSTDAFLAAEFFGDKVDAKKLNAIINEIAALEADTIALTSFTFDRTPSQFESMKEYRKARRKYYSTAYNKLNKDFIERAVAIVDQLNAAVPEDVRKVITGK